LQTSSADVSSAVSRIKPRTRHLLSTATLSTLYVLFAYAHLVDLINNGFRLSLALIVAFETVMVLLVFLRRRSDETDMSAMAVTAGMIGSFAILAARPLANGEDLLIGQILQVVGGLLQLGSSASIGRSFGIAPANRGIQTSGLYRLVRHPFYMSYLVTQGGYLVSNFTVRNVTVLLVATVFQVVRIHYEERLLSNDEEYVAYTDSVRWHLVPGVW
jgi:protein-S-isoprenylcysteine O-methyltransferase Ste14